MSGFSFRRLVRALTRIRAAFSEPLPEQPNAAAMSFVYRHALRRTPNADELDFWSNALRGSLTFQQFVLEVMTSPEASIVAAAAARAEAEEPSPVAISFVHQHALNRTPDSRELAAWSGALRTGLTFQQFVLELLTSPEGEIVGTAKALAAAEEPSPAAISFVYQHALDRTPDPQELDTLSSALRTGLTFQRFLLEIVSSPEAMVRERARTELSSLSDGLFIAHLYEACVGRCAFPSEILDWKRKLDEQRLSRGEVALSFLAQRVQAETARAGLSPAGLDSHVILMGTTQRLDQSVWNERKSEVAANPPAAAFSPPAAPAGPYVLTGRCRVSVITSLYKGGAYIEQFLANIMTQSLGEDFELLIIDAGSPDNEINLIREYQLQHKNVRYERLPYRVGIYDAWNIAVGLAEGEYLTNANVDDLRRPDSLQIQSAILDQLSFVDVVYQDVFYSFESNISFEGIANLGFQSQLPLVSANTLLAMNSPHNAPMWRKALHRDVGPFDGSLRSAGDYDFWLRCVQAGKVFYKTNSPHVAYYHNPEGASTRPDSPGPAEAMQLLKKYGRHLISPLVYMESAELAQSITEASGIDIQSPGTFDPYLMIQAHLAGLLRGRAGAWKAAS